MGIVFVRELKIQTVIGIFDWERAIRQTVVLDLEMASDIAKAGRNDNIDDALNYKSVSDRITAFVEASQFQLVETMAEKIAALVMDEFSVPWVRLRLGKPGALPNARDVGVIIERGVKP
ncbi:dihydroneopterin aldolase [Ketobacter sp. MCCC 1A13808]|uniref:dihydroneopterin aldolase n=1 Tax=Ketobacter sp. MCCC 1A13808 TaxID=2602738 RepID=UPI000F28CC9C|nr:dihydroneopterin aldolase [Ketobacter sp. MCCC 1A13808]MVF13181.1 dihydroneopterin aldolase [Ketobacter sp. MCCC 1A13808]RLP52540.1 MAG: dihydroneopterin aldolase [Ketobacter sp.]